MPLRYGVAGLANRLDGAGATLFPGPGGHAMPVVAGLLGSREWIAEAMGVEPAGVLARYGQACTEPRPLREVTGAVCQQVVHEKIDLESQLPIPTHNERDSGPYITAGLLITRGAAGQNVSIHRLQVSGPDRLGALLLPRHTHALFSARENEGIDLEVAIVIGVDPLTLLASQAIVPLGQDELEIAGALHGADLPVTRCLTNDLLVPADAEIVLEGRLLAGKREEEGPFGEFPQYYGKRTERHVIAVDTITHRADAIYHTIVGGSLEHLLLGAVPREASFLTQLRRMFPCVRDLHLSRGGTCRYHLAVQIDRHSPGEAKNVILGALALHYDIKQVTVVDGDVDVHDSVDVEWAVATRFQPDRDLVVVGGAQTSKLDPSADDGLGSRMGMDATVPAAADPDDYVRIHVPGQSELDVEELTQAAPPNWQELVRQSGAGL